MRKLFAGILGLCLAVFYNFHFFRSRTFNNIFHDNFAFCRNSWVVFSNCRGRAVSASQTPLETACCVWVLGDTICFTIWSYLPISTDTSCVKSSQTPLYLSLRDCTPVLVWMYRAAKPNIYIPRDCLLCTFNMTISQNIKIYLNTSSIKSIILCVISSQTQHLSRQLAVV